MQTKTERYFYDSEEDKVYSLEELSRIYVELKEDGCIEDDETFSEWLNNCTSKNGSLDEISNNSLKDYVKEFYGKSYNDKPLMALDWETEMPICGWGINGMDDYIVVRDFYDMLYDVEGDPIAFAVLVMKKRRVKL